MSRETFRPSPHQELLLRVVLAERSEVEAAWRAWQSQVDLDDADASSFRLMPHVYLRLAEAGVDDPDLPRLKGIYRYAWAANHVRLRALVNALDVLDAADIETVVFRGAALIHRLCLNVGVRPMADADILVHESAVPRAWRALREAGFDPLPEYGEYPDSRLSCVGGINLRQEVGDDVDLLWGAVPYAPSVNEAIMRDAERVLAFGRPMAMPIPTHELLLALVHGSKFREAPPIRWVPDAILLLRAFPIDWDELCRQTKAAHVPASVAAQLRYLRESHDAPVPAEVVSDLERTPATGIERRLQRGQPSRALYGLSFHRYNYLKYSAADPWWRRKTGFPFYLRDWWGTGSVWLVPAEAARRFAKGAAKPPPPPSVRGGSAGQQGNQAAVGPRSAA